MEENIKISIITASYNYENYIKDTIESVIAQTYQNWELIIVDDGSKDNSVEVIKSYCEKDNRIKLYQHENGINKGLSKTVQLGIEKAQTEWIAFLESDDTITPNYLEEKIKVVKENPDVVFIFNDLKMFGDEKTIHNYDEWFRLQQKAINEHGHYADFFDEYVEHNIVPTFSAVMVKKSIMESLDYNTKGGEPRLDYTLWEQIALNHKFYYVDKKLTNWRMHPDSYISTPMTEMQDFLFIWHFYKLSLKRHNPFKFLPYVFKSFRRILFRCHLNEGKILLFGKWIQLFKKDQSPRILVTGGAGYIGSHCVLELLKNKYNVLIFDNLSTGHIETVEELKKHGDVKFIKGDLQNPTEISKAIKHHKIDAVIHFAAFSQVGESVTNPQKYYMNNVYGTLNLLNSMVKYDINKIVFSSTAATYGEPKYIPIDENHPQTPINPYGQTKLIIEKIMDDYDKAYGLKSVRLRYFNVAGADSQKRIGEWHEPETHLIPNILKSTFKEGKVFKMFGDDYDTKDGTCIRDYINIEDLANAHILALEYLNNKGKTNYFNLGTKEGSTVKEVFTNCENITEKHINVEIKPRREGDPATLVADNSKAKDVLKWTPEHNIEYSIKTAYEWEKVLQKKISNK